MSRHLDWEEKERTVRGWLEYRQATPHTTSETGGHGFPDAEVFALTDALNALPGICTTQSCAGHRLRSAEDGREYIQPGELWLRLGRWAMHNFTEQAPLLAREPSIERLSVLYSTGYDEVVDIQFRGNGHGEDELPRSAETIIRFFREEVACD